MAGACEPRDAASTGRWYGPIGPEAHLRPDRAGGPQMRRRPRRIRRDWRPSDKMGLRPLGPPIPR
jgi:hypothetical protein